MPDFNTKILLRFSKKQKTIFLIFVLLLIAFLFSPSNRINSKFAYNTNNVIFFNNSQEHTNNGPLQMWEAPNSEQDGPNSFVTIQYNKCIPVQQCSFEDCNIEGSYDGKGNYCLPTNYSKIGDWAPDISLNVFGIPVLNNPAVYSAPVEHTQASSRLPDKDNNAYFMFSNSQNYYGFIWVVEVQGLDPERPQHLDPTMPANVVWWQKLNKCNTIEECNAHNNPGNFNHPARISRIANTAVIAFQNYSFTLEGKFDLSIISNRFKNTKISIPKSLETSTLPVYPKVRSADSIAIYDVSNPRHPVFKQKLAGDQADLWGGFPPGRDISEVAIARAGNFYHLNVGGTFYNINNQGINKGFAINYRMQSLYANQNISPLLGNVEAYTFTNIKDNNLSIPTKISLNTVPYYHNNNGYIKYALTLQLVTTPVKYNNNPKHVISESTDSTYLDSDRIYSNTPLFGEFSDINQSYVLDEMRWMSEACIRAWGFQMLDNGGYNVICHDIDPHGKGPHTTGRFLVRGVSPEDQSLYAAQQRL